MLCHMATGMKKVSNHYRDLKLCDDNFDHINEVVTLDATFFGHSDGESIFAKALSQHSGPAYINNLEKFIEETSAMKEIISDASSTFWAEA